MTQVIITGAKGRMGQALIACAKTVKIPLLIAAMGEQTGLSHRHALAQAGLACFETPEAAISGFRHLIRNRRNRAAARDASEPEEADRVDEAGYGGQEEQGRHDPSPQPCTLFRRHLCTHGSSVRARSTDWNVS